VSIPQQALFEQFVASLDHARTVSPFFKAKHPEFGHGSIVKKKDFFLDVDKQAHNLREKHNANHAHVVQARSAKFHQVLKQIVSQQVTENPSQLIHIANIDTFAGQCMDMLAKPACSNSLFEPLAMEIPWFYDQIIKIVNNKPFHKTDKNNNPITVDTLKTAINFIGFENLQMLLPALIFKRTLPQITDPYPEIKHRVWELAVGTANCAKFLAPDYKLNPAFMFMAAMFHYVGKNTVTRIFFKQFDILHKEQMQSAEKALMKDEFESLRDVTPDPSTLAELIAQHASHVSDAIIKEMTFSYLPIHTLFHQLAHNDYEQSAPQLINSCERYVQTRMLLKQHLISADTAKTQLLQLQFSGRQLSALNKMAIKQLKFVDLS
jgi:hypothetical protein